MLRSSSIYPVLVAPGSVSSDLGVHFVNPSEMLHHPVKSLHKCSFRYLLTTRSFSDRLFRPSSIVFPLSRRSVSVPSLVFGLFIMNRWPTVISVSDSTNERPANAGALTSSGLSSTMELVDVATSLRHVWIQDMDVEKSAPMMDVDGLPRSFSL